MWNGSKISPLTIQIPAGTPEYPQEQWNHIIKSCLTAGEEILGARSKEKHHDDVILKDLSSEQKL